MLFYTGVSRSASAILRDQDERSRQNDADVIDNLHFTKELGLRSQAALEAGNLHEFAELMREHWAHKQRRSKSMTNERINTWYELGMANGALGGKLIGAGGGGFIMFYTEDKTRLRRVMTGADLQEVRFRFDFEGTKIIV